MASHVSAPQPALVIRCDASARVGFGHAVRSLALADAFQATGRWTVLFAMNDDRDGVVAVERRGYTVVSCPPTSPEGAWLEALVASRDAAVAWIENSAYTNFRSGTARM